MWRGVRVVLGITLLLLILIILISPYVDLPPVTLRAWHTALSVIALIACGMAIASIGETVRRPAWWSEVLKRCDVAERGQSGANFVLRC